MNFNRLFMAVLVCCITLLLFAPSTYALALGSTQAGYYGQDQNWNRAPDAWNEIQRRGFRDGLDGARKDFENHRQPDVNNRDEYRHPDDIPSAMIGAYREGFRRGYDRGMSHYFGNANWRTQMPMRAWDAPPAAFNEYQQRGFQDGIEGAQKDFDNHRNFDVNNRDEYRRPDNIPGAMREAYRDAFRQGYSAGVSHLGAAGPAAAPLPWNYVPPSYNNYQRRGFQDGMDGAQKDYANHRQPNVNNRDEYRHPRNVPGQMREVYRDAFQRGYQAAMNHLMGGREQYR